MPKLDASPANRNTYGLLALGLAALALLALAIPELVRLRSGWPLNASWYPPVVGPGDETCFYFPDADAISSVKGYWGGESIVVARFEDDPDGQPFGIESTTRQADWGPTVQVGPADRSVRQQPWVRLRLPGDDRFAGKVLTLRIALHLRYLSFHDGKVAEDCENRFDLTGEKLALAVPRAGNAYKILTWSGLAMGAVLLLMSLLVRIVAACALRRSAFPAEVLPE